MSDLLIFLNGAFTCCQAGIAVFFLRYWATYRDRLFLWFFASFAIQAVNRVFIVFLHTPEPHGNVYLARLLAYLLIIVGIVEKNRNQKDVARRRNS